MVVVVQRSIREVSSAEPFILIVQTSRFVVRCDARGVGILKASTGRELKEVKDVYGVEGLRLWTCGGRQTAVLVGVTSSGSMIYPCLVQPFASFGLELGCCFLASSHTTILTPAGSTIEDTYNTSNQALFPRPALEA